jgi:hypothetical protein
MKELGYPQYFIDGSTIFVRSELAIITASHITYIRTGVQNTITVLTQIPWCLAPTVEETVEWLKEQGHITSEIHYKDGVEFTLVRWLIGGQQRRGFKADTLSNAIAKACIWVLEPEKGRK